jgi:cytochrome c-type biogenesis protein
MTYVITFLEGIITFISPCLLPMLPVYIFYFAGENAGTRKTLVNAAGFVLGFSLVFVALGAFAGTLSAFLIRYQTAMNLGTGAIVVLFGLNYMDVLRLPWLNNTRSLLSNSQRLRGFLPAVLFGVVFSIGWTPCVGVFLGSALMLASQQGSMSKGMLLLLCYSLGLGIPFLLSALFLSRIQNAFGFIKDHYKIIHFASGAFLVIIGLLMMAGLFGRLLSMLSINFF